MEEKEVAKGEKRTHGKIWRNLADGVLRRV